MKRNRGKFFIYTGLLLIAAALALIGYNHWEDTQADKAVVSVMQQLKLPEPDPVQSTASVPELPTEQEIPDYILNPNMDMPEQEIDGDAYIGIVEVPSCEIELPVISNWSYPSLKRAPCRFDGSAYTNDLILAGHSYNAHFRRLRELFGGEEIIFTDVAGNRFCYEVVGVETIDGSDLESLEAGDWDLTLFTCTTGGTARILIRCERTDSTESTLPS